MGIEGLNVFTEVSDDDRTLRLAQAAKEEQLIEAHRRGKHPWGSMRRDCPLCQK